MSWFDHFKFQDNSAAMITTEVVPSPTSVSWYRAGRPRKTKCPSKTRQNKKEMLSTSYRMVLTSVLKAGYVTCRYMSDMSSFSPEISLIDLQVGQLHQNLGCWMFHLDVNDTGREVGKRPNLKVDTPPAVSRWWHHHWWWLRLQYHPPTSCLILEDPEMSSGYWPRPYRKHRDAVKNTAKLPWTSLNWDP